MVDKQKIIAMERNYRKSWGRWFVISGIVCALVTFIVSAWVGLTPFMSIIGAHRDKVFGDTYTFNHGFYNLIFYTGTNATIVGVRPNTINLSTAGIAMICFMSLSVLLTLFGFAESRAKLFYENGNMLFISFLIFIIVIGIIMAAAIFADTPKSARNADNIFTSKYFNKSTGFYTSDLSRPTFSTFWLRPSKNYWILLGCTIAIAMGIIAFGVLTSRQMFKKSSRHIQSIR